MKTAILLLVALVVAGTVLSTVPVRASSTALTFVPISPTSSRTFFYGGSTMPFKFQLFDPAGNIVSTATATIWVNASPGTTNGGANTHNNFRYDPTGQLYIYNLSTKNLPVPGPNTIRIIVSDGTSHDFIVTFH